MTAISINANNRSIELTKTFAAASSKFGTPEYDQLQQVRRDYPNYKVVTIARKAPKTDKPTFKGLTYTDFIFVNRFGQPQHQGTLNKALRRIIRDCNDEIMLKGQPNSTMLPHFSCHSLRHTFATRMCEAGVNVKVIQDSLGHADVSTTLNIYADATRALKMSEFVSFEAHWSRENNL